MSSALALLRPCFMWYAVAALSRHGGDDASIVEAPGPGGALGQLVHQVFQRKALFTRVPPVRQRECRHAGVAQGTTVGAGIAEADDGVLRTEHLSQHAVVALYEVAHGEKQKLFATVFDQPVVGLAFG